MARTAGSLAVLGVLGGLVWAQQAGCDPEPTPLEFTGVLESVGPAVIEPKLEAFRIDAVALSTAVDAWAADPGAKVVAQDAWRVAMGSWHEVDPLRIGPLGVAVGTEGIPAALGGENYIDLLYSWPTVNRCLVDQNTVSAAFAAEDFFTTSLVNAYGLDVLGQLLFAGPENDCPGQVPINRDGTWAALGAAGIETARSEYAVALASRVVSDTDAALASWRSFALNEATYGNEQVALNAVFDALFTLNYLAADRKLSEPFGERNCVESCLELVEGRGRGEGSHLWLAANLRGVRDLFTAGDAPGFDDLLAERGQESVATAFLVELDEAIAAAERIDEPLDVLFERDPTTALALLAGVREASDLLSNDVRTALSLVLPQESLGDLD